MLTESTSHYDHLEQLPLADLLRGMNREDQTVPLAVERAIPQIETLVTHLVPAMRAGGRLFYIGAGTSGRLGIVDASECPPTFGVPHELVVGLMAGGDGAIRRAVEFAEDDPDQAWRDLEAHHIAPGDFVVGIAASGRTPYVIGGLLACRQRGILTGCLTCNPGSPLAQSCDFPVELLTGPEFLTGSTRLKAGTAQKLALNMISTSTMIQLGRVKGNQMVDMQLSNEKLIQRGVRMLMGELRIDEAEAAALIARHGGVRKAMLAATQP